MEQRQEKRSEKTGVEVIFDKIKEEVPPVVIKGGSIEVEFPVDAFKNAADGSDVRLAKHPDDTRKITLILITDNMNNLLNAFTLPANLGGRCIIRVFDDHGLS